MKNCVYLVVGLLAQWASARPQLNYQSPGGNQFGGTGPALNYQGGGGGGELRVNCQKNPGPDGRVRFVCAPLNPNLVTLRSEHILWLSGPKGGGQALEIEVPNYRVDELIKAGFKKGPGGGRTQINLLLRKPEQTYGAVAENTPDVGSDAEVSLQYEPVGPVQVVHFPNDQQYQPLSGPILPPDNGAGGNRYNRQAFPAQLPQQQPGHVQQFRPHQQQQPQYYGSPVPVNNNWNLLPRRY